MSQDKEFGHLSFKPTAVDTELLNLAFLEDLGSPALDITTSLLLTDSAPIMKARILSKHPDPIISCGLPVVEALLQRFAPACHIESAQPDGTLILPQTTLYTLAGPAAGLLMLERIILNFLQHLCAISTLTFHYVAKIRHTQAQILDTRKTTPGFRHLEKYAVQCGGGANHRMGLYDAVMVKDTHSDFLGGMTAALAKLPDDILQRCPVIVEIQTPEELSIILEHAAHKVSRVLLDNMSPELMTLCAERCKDRLPTEASGNIDLENISDVAKTGVDFISVGKITHSAGSVDLSMKSGE
jgi:nicotinate-nucleotide pyrophosphorylase (carboxylating)